MAEPPSEAEDAANPWADVASHPPKAVDPSSLDDLDPFAPARPASISPGVGGEKVEKAEGSLGEANAAKSEPTAPAPVASSANAPSIEPTPASVLSNPFDAIKSVFSRSTSSTPVPSHSPPGTPSRPVSGGGLLQAIVGTGAMGRDQAARPAATESQAFDFGRFQAQMRSREAEPVVKYLRSFLQQFSRRTWPVCVCIVCAS